MLFKNLLEHIGIEPGRLHFSWISSAEATKFVDVVNGVIQAVKEAGGEIPEALVKQAVLSN